MKALGKDIWDFYVNGWPEGYSHDSYDREVAYWPCDTNTEGAYSLLENEEEYDLKDFGTLWRDIDDTVITFEDAFLAWKGIHKLSFDDWFNDTHPKGSDTSKCELRKAWYAALENK